MTEEEYKFLEVIYQRGAIHEPSLVNYLEGKIEEPQTDKSQAITKIFKRFQQSGLIDNQHEDVYEITELGKEKFRELNRDRKHMYRKPSHTNPFKKIKSFRPDSRFWRATLILAIIASILISMIISRWDQLSNLFREVWP